MATDARTRYTKKAIENSFLRLLKEKPIDKITVKEVCETSGIHRATFYRYFNDAYDWLDKMESAISMRAREIIRGADSENLPDVLTRMLTSIKAHAPIFEIMNTKYGDYGREDRFLQMCVRESKEAHEAESVSDPCHDLKEHFIVYGCFAAIRRWVESGMKEEPAQVAAYLYGIYQRICT
jgi:AcrR family transcriptional regulator